MDLSFLLLLSMVVLVITVIVTASLKDVANRRWDKAFTLPSEMAVKFPGLVMKLEKIRERRVILAFLTFVLVAICATSAGYLIRHIDFPSGTVAPLAVFAGAIWFILWRIFYILALIGVGLYIKRKLESATEKALSA